MLLRRGGDVAEVLATLVQKAHANKVMLRPHTSDGALDAAEDVLEVEESRQPATCCGRELGSAFRHILDTTWLVPSGKDDTSRPVYSFPRMFALIASALHLRQSKTRSRRARVPPRLIRQQGEQPINTEAYFFGSKRSFAASY